MERTTGPAHGGGIPPAPSSWLTKVLVAHLARTKDAKLQEAALLALAALAKENKLGCLPIVCGGWVWVCVGVRGWVGCARSFVSGPGGR